MAAKPIPNSQGYSASECPKSTEPAFWNHGSWRVAVRSQITSVVPEHQASICANSGMFVMIRVRFLRAPPCMQLSKPKKKTPGKAKRAFALSDHHR